MRYTFCWPWYTQWILLEKNNKCKLFLEKIVLTINVSQWSCLDITLYRVVAKKFYNHQVHEPQDEHHDSKIKIRLWQSRYTWVVNEIYNLCTSTGQPFRSQFELYRLDFTLIKQKLIRTSRCNKVDAVRLYASNRFNLLLLKGQRLV